MDPEWLDMVDRIATRLEPDIEMKRRLIATCHDGLAQIRFYRKHGLPHEDVCRKIAELLKETKRGIRYNGQENTPGTP